MFRNRIMRYNSFQRGVNLNVDTKLSIMTKHSERDLSRPLNNQEEFDSKFRINEDKESILSLIGKPVKSINISPGISHSSLSHSLHSSTRFPKPEHNDFTPRKLSNREMPILLNIETKKLELVPQSAEEEEERKKEIMAMSCTELIEKVADEILFDIPFGGIKVKEQVKKVERSIINIDRELTDYEEIMDEVNI